MFKSLIKGIVISVLSLAMFVSAIPMVSARADEDTEKVYRLYNATSKRYLYTTDENEVDVLSKGKWRYDGIAWYAPTSGTGIFRIFSLKSNIHVYTGDQNEIDVQVNKNGFLMDNDGREMFFSGGGVKVIRFFNKKTGAHFFTTNAVEMANLRADKVTWLEEPGFLAVAAGEIKNPAGEIELPADAKTIENTPAEFAIEADMKVTGSGTGYHAKLVLAASGGQSAVSFGIQHDMHARAPYTGIPYFMSETVKSNAIGVPGEQIYNWHKQATTNEYYKVMITVDKAGKCNFYVNGVLVGTSTNPKLAGVNKIYHRCEASARKNGDTVKAEFKNVKLRVRGVYDPAKKFGVHNFDSNRTMKSEFSDATKGVISGTISGLAPNQDWDNAYGAVSGTIQFTGVGY